MKKPNFFIIGAPKCGTTSLAVWLSEHPQIYFSPRKEPHYFNQDGLTTTHNLQEYEALFANAQQEHIAVGEGSTHYLYSQVAVPKILDYNPDSRFIVCLRNPVEMAPALHSECIWQGEETVESFQHAWHLQPERRLGKQIPLTVKEDPERLQYGAYCRLGEQLERLYRNVAKEQALPILLDDLRENPKQEYQKILDFLGIAPDNRKEFPAYNRRKRVHSVMLSQLVGNLVFLKKRLGLGKRLHIASSIRKLNGKRFSQNTSQLSPVFIADLKSYFRDDIRLLETLLARDLSKWLK